MAIGRTDFGQKVNVATQVHAAIQIAVQYRLFLLFAHGPFVQIRTLIRFEAGAVVARHQGHAKLV